MSIQNKGQNVSSRMGDVRKAVRGALRVARGVKEDVDGLQTVKQTAGAGTAALNLTADLAKAVRTTFTVQDKVTDGLSKVTRQGPKTNTDNGKNVFRIFPVGKDGKDVGAGVFVLPFDGKAVWKLLSGAKGILCAEQVELIDERTDDSLTAMEVGDVIRIVKRNDKGDEWEKLIRKGTWEGVEGWEVFTRTAGRRVNLEMLTGDVEIAPPTDRVAQLEANGLSHRDAVLAAAMEKTAGVA